MMARLRYPTVQQCPDMPVLAKYSVVFGARHSVGGQFGFDNREPSRIFLGIELRHIQMSMLKTVLLLCLAFMLVAPAQVAADHRSAELDTGESRPMAGGAVVQVQNVNAVFAWVIDEEENSVELRIAQDNSDKEDAKGNETGMDCRLFQYSSQVPERTKVDPDNCYWSILYSIIND
jgi:hypothetical protein